MTPPSKSAGAAALATASTLDGESEAAILAEERALDAARLAQVLAAAFALWGLVGLVYVPIATWIDPQPISRFLIPHALAWAAMGVALWRVRRDPRGEGSRSIVLALGLVAPAIATGIVSISYRGVVSPFAHGILTVLTAYAIALPTPWRRSWPWLALIVLAWPITLLAASLLVPELAAQLGDPRARADFQESVIAQLVGALLAGVGQHAQWQIRREVLVAAERHRYRLEEKLGEGGMGVVHRAFHPGLGRHVALKILRDRADETMAARFVREVRATAVLQHPGTVRVLDCGTTEDGHLYYTMELLSGVTLHDLVRRGGPLSPERATYLVLQASRALAEAHARGLIHRDVKPENLFVTEQGGRADALTVLDFGIAKSLALDASLTADGALIGTPRFMSLEQALGEPVDARADVYALGAVLYFALTGTPPIEEPTIFAVVAAHASGSMIPVGVRAPDVPPALETIVTRCLAGDREARFVDAGELARALASTGLAQAHRPSRVPAVISSASSRVAASEDPTRAMNAG